MKCKNTKGMAKHSGLCHIEYPYNRIADSSKVKASHTSDCTLAKKTVPSQNLAFEAHMHLVSLEEFESFVADGTKFGTYCAVQKSDKSAHFCVDNARRTVDGRRLGWLWVFPQGQVGPAHKNMGDNPTFVWTKPQIVAAYKAANNPTLPMWTRHVDRYSELAITFCLPFPV